MLRFCRNSQANFPRSLLAPRVSKSVVFALFLACWERGRRCFMKLMILSVSAFFTSLRDGCRVSCLSFCATRTEMSAFSPLFCLASLHIAVVVVLRVHIMLTSFQDLSGCADAILTCQVKANRRRETGALDVMYLVVCLQYNVQNVWLYSYDIQIRLR